VFRYFLDQLFEITMELDGSINTLNTYTISVHYRVWRYHIKEVVNKRLRIG